MFYSNCCEIFKNTYFEEHLLTAASDFLKQLQQRYAAGSVLTLFLSLVNLLGDDRNYMPPILVPSSAKRIATQILVIAKLNERLLN